MNNQEAKEKVKKPFYKKVWFWILVVIVVAIAAGGSSESSEGEKNVAEAESTGDVNSDANVDVEQEEDADASAEDSTEENINVAYGEIGEISEGLELLVNGVTEAESISAADGYMSYDPESGKYAIVNVTINNNSKESKSLLINYFKLVGPDEAEYVSTIIPVADDKFITADTINPNLGIEGNLVFEIPKDLSVSDFRLKYSDYNLFSDILYFNLK